MFLCTPYRGLKNGKKRPYDIYDEIDALNIIISGGSPQEAENARAKKKILREKLREEMRKKEEIEKKEKLSKYKYILLEIIRKKHLIAAYLYTSDYNKNNNIQIKNMSDAVITTMKDANYDVIKNTKSQDMNLTKNEKIKLCNDIKEKSKVIDSKKENNNPCFCM